MISDKSLWYNALDAACTLECRDAFWDQLNEGYSPAYHLTTRLFPVLTFMMTRGILVNREALEEVKKDIIRKAAEKQQELNQLCGRELNINSYKDCQKYFY